ncbi:MAG TPA: hypothetical protein VH475_08195, partial [Tepidisphaeraceae bacterium]
MDDLQGLRFMGQPRDDCASFYCRERSELVISRSARLSRPGRSRSLAPNEAQEQQRHHGEREAAAVRGSPVQAARAAAGR